MNKKVIDHMKAREEAFNLRVGDSYQRNEYNALFDPNMRHYFENRKVQDHLYKTGQIDRHGRVIDHEKSKSKMVILEREFAEAQKVEQKRVKEEMEMRYRVQKKRFDDLENIRKQELLQKVRADREIGRQIVSILRSSTALSSPGKQSMRSAEWKSRTRDSKDNVNFFVTELS
jgi:sigma54-dependent transcription regulator